jgi:hypothetical protein
MSLRGIACRVTNAKSELMRPFCVSALPGEMPVRRRVYLLTLIFEAYFGKLNKAGV